MDWFTSVQRVNEAQNKRKVEACVRLQKVKIVGLKFVQAEG